MSASLPADRREAILARLLIVLTAIDGIKSVTRNKRAISEEQRPAIQLFDGDEEEAPQQSEVSRARPGTVPQMIDMHPELTIALGALPENVGTVLNSYRAKVIKAVLSDTGLRDLCGANGEIRYQGNDNSLHQGRLIEGEMGVFFVFRYVLSPSQL
jgi:hypothetical protein